MKTYFELVDTNTTGRCDVTPLFANHCAFQSIILALTEPFSTQSIDFVAGIDALGFILGTAVAMQLKKGFIPIRKSGKLPGNSSEVRFTDYSNCEKGLEIREDIIEKGKTYLLVDEWIETGTQISSAIELIESKGGIIAGIVTLNIDLNPNTRKLQKQYQVKAISENMQF